MIGKILGDRYELIEKIGEGGMAEVYKAKCLKLNRFNAVKILKKEFSSNDEIVDKFKKEATAIANLSHNNIIGVYDVGTQDDIHYIIMEYVKGKTLKQIIKEQGKIQSKPAVEIAIQIAKALECAHKSNIIHRDVKPQNILITEEGIVKVSDFGIAKSVSSSTVAHTTAVLGSAHYFSPEQAKGSYVDERTDIYSLGVVIYEMVTGKIPFDADNAVSIALKHIQEEVVPPNKYTPEIPDVLNDLILKAMEKEPIKRYQSVRDLLNDLVKIKNDVNFSVVNNSFDDDHTRIMAPVNPQNSKKAKEKDEDDEDDEEEKSPKKKRKTIILLTLLALLMVSLGVLAASLTLRGAKPKPPENIKVPQIIGMNKDDAERKLKDLGLNMTIMDTIKSDEPEGTVISANPDVNTEVKRNSTVTVVISGGAPMIKAPELEKLDINAAKQILKVANLELGEVTYEYSDDIAKDVVIRQSPSAGKEVKKDSKIDLVVSKGKEVVFVTVPSLIKLTQSQAKDLLESYNLKLGNVSTKATDNKEEDGKIIYQDKKVNDKVEKGTSVDVSIGKYTPKTVNVGAYISKNQKFEEAEANLNKLVKEYNLKVSYKGLKNEKPSKKDVIVNFTETVEENGELIIEFKEQ